MIEEMLTRVMTEYGAMLPGWKLEIQETDGNSGDWVKIRFQIFKPRKRKACTAWTMRVNQVTGYIDWEKTEHINL